jgi:hypothetical protein
MTHVLSLGAINKHKFVRNSLLRALLPYVFHKIEVVQKTSKITTFQSTSIGLILKPIFKTLFGIVTFSFPLLYIVSEQQKLILFCV